MMVIGDAEKNSVGIWSGEEPVRFRRCSLAQEIGPRAVLVAENDDYCRILDGDLTSLTSVVHMHMHMHMTLK
jgi:hypothetical protein